MNTGKNTKYLVSFVPSGNFFDHSLIGSFNNPVSTLMPKAIIIADEDACAELKVGTYKYFKDIEGANLDPDTQL